MTIYIDPTAQVSRWADIEPSVRGTRILIGAHSVVDAFVKFKPAGGTGDVVIGEHVTINSGCVFYTGNGIAIGHNVLVAANCVFAPANHAFISSTALIRKQGFMKSRGGIIVEDDVWIGAGVVLLDGARVRRGAVIGAQSLVRGEVPSYKVAAGNPLIIRGERN